jgi:hypothetical protein
MSRRFLPSVIVLLAAQFAFAQTPAPTSPPPALPPTYAAKLSLVRYDLPRGFSSGFAPTRQPARRVEGTDAVEWPDFTLNGQPLWRGDTEEKIELRLRKGEEAAANFQVPADDVIQPGNHWLRSVHSFANRKHLYTADNTARTGPTSLEASGRYELWTFPFVIKSDGAPAVKNVVLKYGGRVVFQKPGPWRSLTLLLPASEPGKKYELTVAGRPPIAFEAGLMPVKLGTPQERTIPINATVAGDGPKITFASVPRAATGFPHQREWDADVAALGKEKFSATPFERAKGIARWVGIEVPRSPFTIYAAALPHGMSGGFFKKGTKPEEYAAMIADAGYDAVFDQANALVPPGDPASFERRASALAELGVKFGLQYDNNGTRPSLQHPSLTFLAHTLPEWHAPLYRSLSLTTQRFTRLPNFLGLSIGADNAGYANYRPTAPPSPDRPWGEAMIAFAGTQQPRVPRAPTLGRPEFSFEKPVDTAAEFLKYVERYDASFQQYGYFAEAVREAGRAPIFTTASFGSSPGDAARGGWMTGTVPGRLMFQGVDTQQAYDWNATHAAKPLHNVALIDRLRSYTPRTRTWALLDDYRLLYGREAWQRAVALALTRGIQGFGTNFLADPSADSEQSATYAARRELNAWVHKYGGVYSRTTPEAVIGIFYGHQQAVLRPVVAGENADAAKVLEGSLEGKVTEALFMCHAAGWPARVVTYQEIARGPLPRSMKALLLVGLEAPDPKTHWAPGLEPMLQQFLTGGGRILADEKSFCPVPSTSLGLRVAAYVPQSNFDSTPLLFARNAENIAILRAAMQDVAEPIAVSDEPTVWAIPTRSGDTQYVTVVNQAYATGPEAAEMLRPADPKATKPEPWKTKGNASLYVKPQTGSLRWNTRRPIYDVRRGRKLTAEQAAAVDLNKDSFQWYALPSAEVVRPELAVEKSTWGYYEAKPAMNNPTPMTGIPVQITARCGDETATVFTATGSTARLPVHATQTPGDWTITATELLTGLNITTTLSIPMPEPTPAAPVDARIRDAKALDKFAKRKNVGLKVALTPEQERDPKVVEQARLLVAYYVKQGRNATLGSVRPQSLVESLQPLQSPHRYPQWKTIPSDLMLFGTAANNVLLLDQARGQIFPRDFSIPPAGHADVIYTRSPFVGECDVVNVIASDLDGMAAAVRAITVQK